MIPQWILTLIVKMFDKKLNCVTKLISTMLDSS